MRIFTADELPQKTLRWHETRRGRICSSDVPDFVDGDGNLKRGRSKGETIGQAVHTYVAKLVSERVTGHMDISDFANQAMQYGSQHEDAARAALSLTTGEDYQTVGGFLSDCGRWWASTDGAVIDGQSVVEVAEIKIPVPKTQVRYLLDRQLFLDEYRPQVCMEILVTGAERGRLFSYGAGFQCREANLLETIEASDPFIASLRTSLRIVDELVQDAMGRLGASGGLSDPDAGSEVLEWLGLSEEPHYATS